MNYCIYCGAPLDSDSQFCANCGKKIKMCHRCGAVLKGDSLFCARCGTHLNTQIDPIINYQQSVPPLNSIQEEADVIDEWEEENNKKWKYLFGGIALVVVLTLSWVGFTQFNKYTHIDIHELLENLQLPKDYYQSAKEIVNKPDFDLDNYKGNDKYVLRGWIVYNQKYGSEIRFNNKSFNFEKDDIDEFFWVIGHILDCWNTSPAKAVYKTERDGSFDSVIYKSTFYYSSAKSGGTQYVAIIDLNNDNIQFQSVDGQYKADFKQVKLYERRDGSADPL